MTITMETYKKNTYQKQASIELSKTKRCYNLERDPKMRWNVFKSTYRICSAAQKLPHQSLSPMGLTI
ncbi:hypothetical protein GDO81_014362 [Engystomops pustulosus]|uniref:Uncharacterized protein n=1 Tax=Engystomops pustulosus TaxID=76066 RepID=A0AAV7B9R7_ENGPU|nr:hypothetical protein GDO81_014362 [Engystomops pustulosus]